MVRFLVWFGLAWFGSVSKNSWTAWTGFHFNPWPSNPFQCWTEPRTIPNHSIEFRDLVFRRWTWIHLGTGWVHRVFLIVASSVSQKTEAKSMPRLPWSGSYFCLHMQVIPMCRDFTCQTSQQTVVLFRGPSVSLPTPPKSGRLISKQSFSDFLVSVAWATNAFNTEASFTAKSHYWPTERSELGL